MTAELPSTRTNRDLLKALKTPVARFYPCDLHVHSVGSYDVCLSDNFPSLPQPLRDTLTADPPFPLPLTAEPVDPASHDEKLASPAYVEAFYDSLTARRAHIGADEGIPDSDNWAIVGVTDHNAAHFSTALARYAWERRKDDRLIIFPGLELQVDFPYGDPEKTCQVHILCLYKPCTSASDIRLAINESRPSGTDNWDFGRSLAVSDLPVFVQALRSHERYPAVCIGAHVWSQKGIECEPKKVILAAIEAEIARLEGELERAKEEGAHADEVELTDRLVSLAKQTEDGDQLHIEVLKLIGRCGFDGLQVRDPSHETHYRRLHRFRENHGRSVPIVCSDAHSPNDVFTCQSGIPFAKLPMASVVAGDPTAAFDELRNRVLRFGETRTTYATPKSVTHWIEGIEIVPDAKQARRFWQSTTPAATPPDAPPPFTLSLSRNLNCFVGGRGSGKSAGIEAIAFLTKAKQFNGVHRERDRPDWYDRALATLSGCRLRVVWKSTAPDGIGGLPKRALVLTRYFDPDGRHDEIDARDTDGNAIVDDTVAPPPIRILRSHEIEETARPDNLRRLFDDLCGPRIETLSDEIESARTELTDQRTEIVEVCTQLAELTKEGSALRQYGIRKQQFEKVNRPELREKYEKLDREAAISKTTSDTVDTWNELSPRTALDDIEGDLSQFFDDTERNVLDDDGVVVEGYEPLHNIVRASDDPEQPGHREAVLSRLGSAKTAIDDLDTALTDAKRTAAANHKAESDELAKQGLPTGASERQSKKNAFEAAKSALKSYNELTETLTDLLDERIELHKRLVTACQEQTDLRKKTAETITAQLARDLDAAVLCIEMDACPLAAKDEFDGWLERNMDPIFSRYAANRRTALIERGIMPATIRDVLLDPATPTISLLEVDAEYARDGRITPEEAQEVLTRCRARKTSQLDEAADWDDAFRESIPSEIRQGITTFPLAGSGTTLCVDEVLQLDEIVLDDLPEIRLNDRPTDPGSEPRPLSELSPGQRCSAILPILLLSGDYPLVIDQPEDNLDNRLIRQVIVNILAAMKLKRQVIIATHNPNLPVLGDVEQCVVLQASGRDLSTVVATGNLDSPDVSRYITDIMEGGREAFQYRQSVYQSHWIGTVDELPSS